MKHPVMHFEIMGQDAPKLRSFYADVFGWNVAAPIPNYAMQYSLVDPVPGFTRGIMGGIGKAPEGYDGHVTFYVVVDDMESAFAKIEAHGGSRMMGPDKVPNGPVIGLFNDPEGHAIGLVDIGDEMRGAPMELVPFIFFYGRCEEALEFYKNVLDGSYEIAMRDGDAVKYATFTALGVSFKASDGMTRRAIDADEGNVSLALNVPDAGRAQEVFDALAEGGKVVTPFGDAQWGGKFGNVHDRFGTEWFVTSAP
ncbi:MAG TPA: VOC family protein [Candidatus Cybelea sp.]|nr:VOC family protein [Candidatus Cybelea sp.]